MHVLETSLKVPRVSVSTTDLGVRPEFSLIGLIRLSRALTKWIVPRE